MVVIALGLFLTVAVAVAIVMVVALPHLRNGSRILTPDGERAIDRVREQAVAKSSAAAGTTWHGLVAVREKAAKAWEPASTVLHDKLDRLEEPRGQAGPDAGAIVVNRSPIGAPRTVPPISGPIPVRPDLLLLPITTTSSTSSTSSTADAGDGRVIDLRADGDDDDAAASRAPGRARPAR